MKVAVAFFGITRSLKYTLKSIQENLFDVLKKNNIDFDIFLHTYILKSYQNVRTGSADKIDPHNINNEEYKLLKPKYVKVEDQDSIKKKLNLNSYRTHPDPWKTNYNSVDNFILGSFSKFQVTEMITKTNIKYDYILFVRPDCYYIDKLPIEQFSKINNNNIIIPSFCLFGPHKINDRFAITNATTYKIYGEIFNKLHNFSKEMPLHSETIIGIHLIKNNINVIRIKFNFSRVRFNGHHVDKF